MAVEIAPATVRDLGYIIANVRAQDEAEFAAIYPEGTSGYEIARMAAASPEAWVARYRGQPAAAMGLQPLTASTFQAWSFGTPRMHRALPALTRFIMGRVPVWIGAGMTRVEARSVAGNDAAHRWMLRMGGDPVACPDYGRKGEDFIMFAWTARDMG